MTAKELRQRYLSFFKSKGHVIIPSASLIPENDPTTLFTTAGMHPLVPYFMGEDHPGGKRVASAQKCIRTTDIDEVGDATHHTFFEMLGNWSFGGPAPTDAEGKAGYFKEEAIEMSWEFLTSPEWLGLDRNRLAVSVFEGDETAPFDEESYDKWKELGISEKRIAKLPKKNNWWGPAGETGPCGPDTEMFYWVGDPDKVPESFNDDSEKWVEIWNDVFMEYEKTKGGKFVPLKQKNVDTGMGLERMLSAMNGFDDNYKTELFWPIIEKIEELSGKKYEFKEGDSGFYEMPKCWLDDMRAMRIIADHIKAAVMIMGDDKGIAPSNTDQGYIVRRLLRRAIRYGKQLGIENNFTKDLAQEIFGIYGEAYSELDRNSGRVSEELEKEENKFKNTLEKGLRQFEKVKKDDIGGREAFNLYQTYGFPLEITVELAEESGVKVDEEEFKKELEKHQELSRTASAGKFKGGLVDSGDETKKLHTAAHLTLAALRKVLGDHVHQKGSNITAERLRFDFSHPEKLTDEQKDKVEKLVNEVISSKLPVICEEMSLDEAREKGAEGVFGNKYGDKVKVYMMGEFSKEICGGPHVKNTGELGKFKIIKEESSSAGVRRVKAVLDS